MSERLHRGHESEHPYQPETRAEHHRPKTEVDNRHHAKESVDKIKAIIEKEAASGLETTVGLESPQSEVEHPTWISGELEDKALKDTLRETRRHLSRADRQFSKFVHNKTVDKISDFSSRTIARPSGLAGAGLAAVLGTLGLLYVSRHYGYEYRFSAFIWLLGAGFAAGLMFELLSRLVRR